MVIEQPGFDSGDVSGEPLAMGEGNELVLPAVQEQYRDGDVGELESPRADQAIAVVPPSLAARGECLVVGAGCVFSQFTRQDGGVCRRQGRGPFLARLLAVVASTSFLASSRPARTVSGSVSARRYQSAA
jgi:hypothetical protein